MNAINSILHKIDLNRGDSFAITGNKIRVCYKHIIINGTIDNIKFIMESMRDIDSGNFVEFKDSKENLRAQYQNNPTIREKLIKIPLWLYFIDSSEIMESTDSRGDKLYYYKDINTGIIYYFFRDKITPRAVKYPNKNLMYFDKDTSPYLK